jgi:hypothetical protein
VEFISERPVGLSTSPSLTDLPSSQTLAGFMRLSLENSSGLWKLTASGRVSTMG